MGRPVVVQGAAISSPVPVASNGAVVKGEQQDTKCRDPIFAVLLYANIGIIIGLCVAYSGDAFDGITVSGYQYEGYIKATVICSIAALVFSGLMMIITMRIPQFMIKAGLLFMVAMTGVWFAYALIKGIIFVAIMGGIFFALMLCYARAVWSRIPFATCNLVTASTSIKNNGGVIVIAYFFALLAFGWSVLFAICYMGLWEKTYDCPNDEAGDGVQTGCKVNYGLLFPLFLSFFFTHQVLTNCVHVNVAGVVGTWWFSPEDASSCCSSGIRDSWVRTMTTSFGSICFGSLLVAIIQALRALANSARNQGDNVCLACVASCILSCLESFLRYFNKWAFIYVGLYGYSYIEAGKGVITLFKNRGWEAIIADDLIGNTLALLSVVTGGLTGVVGLIIETSTDYFDEAGGNSQIVSFFFGFILGLVLCSILMSTIGSAVNAVIVLFAEAPAEFQQNYPELSNKMTATWRSTYPGSI